MGFLPLEWGARCLRLRGAIVLALLSSGSLVMGAGSASADLADRLRQAGSDPSLTIDRRVESFLPLDQPAAVEVLRALGDSDPLVRKTAVQVLGRAGRPRAKLLVGMLKDADRGVRDAAGEALLFLGRPAVGRLLLQLGDSKVRNTVMVVLALFNQGEVVAECEKLIGEDTLPIRERLKVAEYIVEVTTAATHPESRERLAAFYKKLAADGAATNSIRSAGRKLSSQVLLKRDPRKASVDFLAYRYGGREEPYLKGDSVYYLAQPLLKELAGHTGEDYESPLRERVLDWYYGIRLYFGGRGQADSRRAMRKAHDRGTLLEFAGSDDSRERAAAAIFLFNGAPSVKDEELIARFPPLLEDPDVMVRLRTVESAGFTSFEGAKASLENLVSQGCDDEELCAAAADSLAMMTTPPRSSRGADRAARARELRIAAGKRVIRPGGNSIPRPPPLKKPNALAREADKDERSCDDLMTIALGGEEIDSDVITGIGEKCGHQSKEVLEALMAALESVSGTPAAADVYYYLGMFTNFRTRNLLLDLLGSEEECAVHGGLGALEMQLSNGRLQVKKWDEELAKLANSLGEIIRWAQEPVSCKVKDPSRPRSYIVYARPNSLLAAKLYASLWTGGEFAYGRPPMSEAEIEEHEKFVKDTRNDFCTRAWIASLLVNRSRVSTSDLENLKEKDMRQGDNSFVYILEGDAASIPLLIEALNKQGTPEMMQLYSESRRPELSEAAWEKAGMNESVIGRPESERGFRLGSSAEEKYSCRGIVWKGKGKGK